MHIKDDLKFNIALTNLFRASNKIIVLREYQPSHNFLESVKRLYDKKDIPWKEIFYYYIELNEKINLKIMIISSSKLDLHKLEKHSFLLE